MCSEPPGWKRGAKDPKQSGRREDFPSAPMNFGCLDYGVCPVPPEVTGVELVLGVAAPDGAGAAGPLTDEGS